MDLCLENQALRAVFDRSRGCLLAVENRLTGEVYGIADDAFRIRTHETLDMGAFRLDAVDCGDGVVRACYRHPELTVEVLYRLHSHFLCKSLILTAGGTDCLVKKVVVSTPLFSGDQLVRIVEYRYQMNKTFFGRTTKGGFFTGMALPFDGSAVDGDQVSLAFSPNYKLTAGASLDCEAAYFGVYRCAGHEAADLRGELRRGDYHTLPLTAESEAMVAMTSILLGPPRHGPISVLSPACCLKRSWLKWYGSHEEVAESRQVLDFARECGIGSVQDFMPWSGETDKANSLKQGDTFEQHPWSRELTSYAAQIGLRPILWSTMTNSQPWAPEGRAFRPDRPDWRVKPVQAGAESDISWGKGGNCLACEEFRQWLTGHFESLLKQGFEGFSLDGDFIGTGGWYTTTGAPVKCMAEGHSHGAGDAQYACTKALLRFLRDIRARHHDAFLWLMRPMMDLGVWTCANGDAVFPLDENATVENLTGIPDQPANIMFGDKVRIWSRIRVQHHFLPHYLDQVQLFAGIDGCGNVGQSWRSDHLDYLMLSALSSTPNQCFFTGPFDRVPAEDRKTIKRWMDWAQANASYLNMRKDLAVWPKAGGIDGSAHVVGNRGLIFLFNPNRDSLPATVRLDEATTGLKGDGACRVTEFHPGVGKAQVCDYGQTLRWDIGGETAVVLNVEPIK